ncbi:MAG TPA: hypothetical protein VMW05_09835 [Methyloceanibacter sp.]|nr:hypothetical protein [Methyloceanibacter sp.]
MSTSKIIARLIGPLFLVMGLGMVAETNAVRALSAEFLSNLSLIYLAGILTLVAGLAIVNNHNLWVSDWRVIITILGWLSVIGGVIRVLLPGQVQALGANMVASPSAMLIGGIVALVIGAVLSWCAYQDLWEGELEPKLEPVKPARARTARKAAPRKTAARKAATSRKTTKRAPAKRPAKKARVARKRR